MITLDAAVRGETTSVACMDVAELSPVFAWLVGWGGDSWSRSDCLSIWGSQMLVEEVFS